MTIGERIAARRVALGLTQQALATIIGKTVGSISRYENDDLDPRAEVLGALAGALECTTDHLLLGKPVDDESQPESAA